MLRSYIEQTRRHDGRLAPTQWYWPNPFRWCHGAPAAQARRFLFLWRDGHSGYILFVNLNTFFGGPIFMSHVDLDAPRGDLDASASRSNAAVEACPLCSGGSLTSLRKVDGVAYLHCTECGTILAEKDFLARTIAGEARIYDDAYWKEELSSARQRGFGASMIRLAEVFAYARRPVRRFLDVSSGAGVVLDAAAELLPEIANTFWGIEPFPPPRAFQSKHPQYCTGYLSSLSGRFDGGICIEVIEHLPPQVLERLVGELASLSEPRALWYFNSAQPDYVEKVEPSYLDPYKRGHIASYSLDGLRPLFKNAGFTLHALPGRDWAFLAEYGDYPSQDGDDLMNRVWTMLPENRDHLTSGRFGNLLLAAAIESARCYIESSNAARALQQLEIARKRKKRFRFKMETWFRR